MKAALVTRYGTPDDVKVGEAPKPAPAAGEVLVCVQATTVNRTDCGELRPRIIGRLLYGLLRSRRTIFGFDFAGVVEVAGADVKALKPGDRVFGMADGVVDHHGHEEAVAEVQPLQIGALFVEDIEADGARHAQGY